MSEQTKTEGTQEVTIKYDSWILKLLKTHGLSVALMLGGLYYMGNENAEQDLKIANLENKLFDCYEKRISASAVPYQEPALFMLQQYAVLPDKKKRNDYTFI